MRFALSLGALTVAANVAGAQSTLTLDEAIGIARRSNPQLQRITNQKRTADAQVRQKYAALLPSLSASVSGGYTQTGQQFVQGITLNNSSDQVQSSYRIGLNYTVN